jgi:hypothetical protein
LIREVTPESAQIYKEIESRFGTAEMEQLLDLLEAVVKETSD